MLIKTLTVGHLDTNCYVVTNETTLECVVIDPGDEVNTIMDYIEDNRLKLTAILLTHGHFDHTGAIAGIKEETGVPVYLNERDGFAATGSEHLPYALAQDDRSVKNGDVIEAAGLRFEAIATPGHTEGGMTYKVEDALFTGDTLFKGTCGRTDLPNSDPDAMLRSLKALCSLPGDYEVYPGHMDSTTLERERRFNYYCRTAMNG